MSEPRPYLQTVSGRRANPFDPDPSQLDIGDIARALGAVGDCWSLMIVRDVMSGRRRFSEIQKSLDLARNTLTDRLKALVELGVLTQGPASDGSAYLEYQLTAKGADLYLTLAALREWGERWQFKGEAPRTTIVDKKAGRPIAKLELKSEDGRVLGPMHVALVETDHWR